MQARSVRLPLATILLLLALRLPQSLQQQQQQATLQPQVPPAQPQARFVHVSTGQQLADAVAEWGLTGGNTIIQVDSWYISLANVTIQQLQASPGQRVPFSSGNLRLVGQSDVQGNLTLIDAAMKQLTPPLLGATVAISNMIAFNNCEEYVSFFTPQGVALLRSSFLTLVSWTFAYQSVECSGCGVYVRRAVLSAQAYLAGIWRIPILPLQRIMAPFLSSLPAFTVVSARTVSNSVFVTSFQSDQIVAYNTTAKVTSDMDDPVLQSLRAQGLLMPPQFCNGSLLPPELANADVDPLTPAWLADNTAEFLPVLQKAVALTSHTSTNSSTEWMPVPAIVVCGNVTLPPTLQLGTLGWPLLLLGPFNDVPEYAVTVGVDLQQGIDTIRLGSTGKLLIQQLTLTGLGSRVLNASTELDSALPIAAVSPPPGSNPLTSEAHVWLHNVTLMLPARDFLALTTLALDNTPDSIRDCVSPDVRSLADELQRGIRGMSAAGADLVNQRLVLSSFVGWGVNATTLVLVPELRTTQLDYCMSTDSTNCGLLTCAQLAGVLLGAVAGCSLIVGTALFYLFRHKQRRNNKERHHKERTASTSTCPQGVPDGTSFWNVLSALGSAGHDELCLEDQESGPESESDLPLSRLPVPSNSPAQVPFRVASREVARQMVELKATQLNAEADKVVITRVIGQGSSGTVFQGQWRGLPVALKTVLFAADQPNSRAVMEAAISSSLSHPNIVATYRYDIKPVVTVPIQGGDSLQVVMAPQAQDGPQPVGYKLFLMQEYCDMNLSFILDKRLLHNPAGQVDWDSLLLLLLDVVLGLEYLHKNNIIHGDLKPCNILIKLDPAHSSGVIAKLADFGLSNHLQGGATHVSNFQAGTPFYVAPEVTRLGHTSRASDIYSLGVIMWECATGCSLSTPMPDGRVALNPLFPRFPAHTQLPCAYVELATRCTATDASLRPLVSDLIQQLQIIRHTMAAQRRMM